MRSALPINISRVQTSDDHEMFVTLTPPAAPKGHGFIPEQIIGKLLDGRLGADGNPLLTPENFARNGVFLDFMHDVIKGYAPLDAGLIDAAKVHSGGWIYMLDGRFPMPNDDVPAEDVIGMFPVNNGQLGPYNRNPNHRLFTHRGFFVLSSSLQEKLLDELTLLLRQRKEPQE